MDNPTASPRTAPPTTPPVSAAPDSTPDSAASTTSTTLAPPLRPSSGDRTLLQFCESVELAARDLYQSAIDAGVTAGDDEGVFQTLRENHGAYANAISGIVGSAAVARSEDVFGQYSEPFVSTSVTDLASGAYDLESALVATHSEVIGTLDGKDGAASLAGAVIVEARHCAALAAIAGKIDDLDALLTSTATAISPPGDSESSAPASSEAAQG